MDLFIDNDEAVLIEEAFRREMAAQMVTITFVESHSDEYLRQIYRTDQAYVDALRASAEKWRMRATAMQSVLTAIEEARARG